ncbi:MAG TPA: hypothetical protein VJQ55_06380 [Candidatus Binatia bacterium]|nr:hypothetical protein [Candidatus Binatia bacterium]
MRTEVKLTAGEQFQLLAQAAEFRARYLAGKLVKRFAPNTQSPSLKALIRRVERYDEIVANSNYDRLPPALLAKLQDVQVEQVDGKTEFRTQQFQLTDENIGTTSSRYGTGDYALTARELMKLLDAEKSLDVVVHVGARVDVVSSYVASKYPDRTFISNDLQLNLAEHNRLLPPSPNWKIVPGYIIDVLERKEISPKLMVIPFTSCKMTENEFTNMVALATSVKTMLIVPVYMPDPQRFSLLLQKPEKIESSYCTCMRQMHPELPHPDFQHPYHAILERFGYRVIKSEIVKADNRIALGSALVIVATR